MSFLKRILGIYLSIQLLFSAFSFIGKSLMLNCPSPDEYLVSGPHLADEEVRIICNPPLNSNLSPKYPEGDQALLNFIYSKIKYPPIMRSTCVAGRVILKITVDKAGNPIDYEITRGLHPTLDQEVLRVVKMIDKWIPGSFNGKPIRSSFYLPVNIGLR